MGVKLEIWLGTFAVLFALILRYFKSTKQRYEQNIPVLRWTRIKIPLLDGIISYTKFRFDGVSIIDEISKRYNEPLVIKVNTGFQTFYHIGDVDMIQKILKSPAPGHLHKPKELYDIVFPGPLSQGLFASPLETWAPHRKVLSQAFNYKSLDIYLQYTNTCCNEMMTEALETSTNKDGLTEIEMGKLLDLYGFKVITLIVMGSEFYAMSAEERTAFSDAFRAGKHFLMERLLNPIYFLPPVWYFSQKRKTVEDLLAFGSNFVHTIIRRYKDKENSRTPKLDVNATNNKTGEKLDYTNTNTGKYPMTPILEDKEEETEPAQCILKQLLKAGLPQEEIVNEAGSFLVAGYEAVRAALDMTLFQLACHPEYQKRCQEEIDLLISSQKLPEHPAFTLDDLTRLKYLEQCIMESLRLTPTAPVFGRRLLTPLQVSPEWTLQKGDVVLMSPWFVHRASRYYENPMKFDPDRFLAENVRKRHPYSYFPFSLGPRNCVGWKVALIKMKVFLAFILRHYDVSTTDQPEDVKVFFDVTIRLERPYKMTYQRRSHV